MVDREYVFHGRRIGLVNAFRAKVSVTGDSGLLLINAGDVAVACSSSAQQSA